MSGHFVAVPVPAAGFLLLGAVGAGALMARRKKAPDRVTVFCETSWGGSVRGRTFLVRR